MIFAGGVFSWLVMMPAIKFFGSLVPTPIYPSPIPIAQMTSDQLWNYYIRYIGAGAVAAAGPDHPDEDAADDRGRAERGRRGPAQGKAGGDAAASGRTKRDLPVTLVLGGSAVIVLLMWALLTFKPVPGAPTGVVPQPGGVACWSWSSGSCS